MRIRLTKFAIVLIIALNFLILFVGWRFFFDPEGAARDELTKFFHPSERKQTEKPRDRIEEANKFLRQSLTIVFRDFYDFDNDLKSGIEHLVNLIPNINILIISDEIPYPPMNIFKSSISTNQTSQGSSLIFKENVRFLTLNYDITKPSLGINPLSLIHTKYTLLMPDSFRLSNGRQFFQRIIKNSGQNYKQILVVPFTSNNRLINYCFRVNSDVKNWTLQYEVKNSTRNCNLVCENVVGKCQS